MHDQRTDVMAELEAAKALNLACLAHTENRPHFERASVWAAGWDERSRARPDARALRAWSAHGGALMSATPMS